MNPHLLFRLVARVLLLLAVIGLLPGWVGLASGGEVAATFDSKTTVPVTATSYTATGNTLNLALTFAPPVGTNLTVVNNTGMESIQGTFDNLAQGQRVNLGFNGILYPFVASYFGGTGNDLVLVWGSTRVLAWGQNAALQLGDGSGAGYRSVPVAAAVGEALGWGSLVGLAADDHNLGLGAEGRLIAWGSNSAGQLGTGVTGTSGNPAPVVVAGELVGRRVVAVAAGYSHSLGLCADGTVVAWGLNTNGQLGVTTAAPSAPVMVDTTGILSGRKVLAIAAGHSHSLALCEGGWVAAWGANSYGQLGDSSTTTRTTPVWVTRSGVLAGKTVTAIAADGVHSMALCADGTVVGWGLNSSSQLGDGTTTDRNAPVALVRTGVLAGKTVTAIACGGNHGMVLCADGAIAAWGYNGVGQLGDNTTTNRSAPVLVIRSGVLAGKSVVGIAAGGTHSMALGADGTLAAWGGNTYGQLGNNTIVKSSVPVLVSAGAVGAGELPVKVVTGFDHSLALVAVQPPAIPETLAATEVGDVGATLDGSVNANGVSNTVSFEYGLTTAYGSTVAGSPALVTGTSATAVDATLSGLVSGTNYHYRVVASGAGGTVKGADFTFTTSTAASLAGLSTSAGPVQPGFDSQRTFYTLTVANATTSLRVTPTVLRAGATVRVNGIATESGAGSEELSLAVGDNTVVIEVAGEGANTQTYRIVVTRMPETMVFNSATTVPVTVANYQPTGRVNLVLNYAPAIGTRLTVIRNTGGGILDGTFENLGQWEIVYLPYGGKQYRFVANYFGGDGNDLVLEWGGERMLGWGHNSVGKVGDGTTIDRKLPTAVVGDLLADKVIVRCAAGGDHNLALCADGALVAWGSAYNGQLGQGSLMMTGIAPVLVDRSGVLAGRTVVALAAGMTSLALCSDGELASWGYNSSGGVGDGTTTTRSRPVLVDRSGVLAGKRVIAIACGSSYCLALCGDGTIAAWGYNDKGQLGDGTTTSRSSPVLVDMSGELKGRTVVAVAAGGNHNLALCADGTVVGWGNNEKGQLGTGFTSVSSSRPVLVKKVGALVGKTVAAVAAGYTHSLVLCSDGSLVTWGGNYAGELGNGVTGVDSLVPVAVDRSGVLSGKTVQRIINTGSSFNIAFCSDGTLATWGENYYGQLGDNTQTNQSRPVLPVTTGFRAGERWIDAYANSAFCLGVVASQPTILPVPETLAAVDVTRTTATVKGRVNANGLSTRVVFEYGLTTAYGSSAPQTPITMNSSGAVSVSAALSGLLPDRIYHFRVVAKAGSHTLNGADQTFTTNDSAVLTSLTPSAGALTPGFDPDRVVYGLTLPTATTRLTLSAVPNHPDATVRINGEVVTAGQPGPELPLAVGNTSVNVVVTGAGGETLTYQIVVTRLPATFAFAAPNTVPVSAGNFQAVGEAAFSLGFTPALGAVLTVVNATGNDPIRGRFSNLRQWQTVDLAYGGVTYQFVADYLGGTGNDLVLRWGHQRVLMWGYNNYGQLGDGTTTIRSAPVAAGLVLGEGQALVATAVGAGHSLALRSDGVLFAWGNNDSGQLGTGDMIASGVPVPVDIEGELAGRTLVSLSIGSSNSFALCEDGSLFAWGAGYGLLPGRVAMSGALAGKSIASFAVGQSFQLVLCTDGTLAAWGDNLYGQLGDGTSTTSSTPVLVSRSGALAGKEVIAIAVGGRHCLALCKDGTLAGWGHGSDGQIGTTEAPGAFFGYYLVPAVVSRAGVLAGKTIQSIAAGFSYNLALCTDGTLAAWGDNSNSQLGNGTTTDATVPGLVTVSGVLAGKTVSAISAGSQHSLALCSDGTLAAWGYNYNSQLGDGTTTTRSTPVLVLNGERRTGERIGRLVGGLSFDSMVVTVTPPPPVAETLAATGMRDVSATVNGRVNGSGGTTAISFEIGLTTAYGSSAAGVPATVAGGTDTAVSAVLANLTPGMTYHYRVVASGPGGVVKGADQTLTTTDVAKLVSLTVDGAAALSPAFGSEIAHYETTVVNATPSVTVTPVAVAEAMVKVNGSEVASGSASGPLALVVGSNTISIAVTVGGETRTYEVVVTRLPAVMAFASSAAVPVTATGFSVGGLPVELSLRFSPPVGTQLMVLKNTGAGPIQGTFSNLAQWQVVNLSYNNIQSAWVANYFGGTGNDLVLEWAGRRLLAWGSNVNGRLGDGTTVIRTIPTAVADGALAGKWIVRSAAGGSHNLALAADGSLAAWGYNASGQLGTGDAVDRNVPARVEMSGVLTGKTPVALAAGGSHSVVLCSDGTLAAWGLNDKGQLGDGTTTSRNVPVRVTQTGVLAGKSVVAITCGSNHSLVWCSDGTLVTWGDNSSGQLGDGTAVTRTTPVTVNPVGALANKSIAAIASGGGFNLVLCTDGTLAAWGDNPYGQLGNGSILDAATPTPVDRSGVLVGKTVTAIACGGAHSLALCSDGTLAAWGSSVSGQLGNGTNYDYTGKWVPVLVTRTGVLAGKTVTAIAGGESHSLALCSDGTLTGWGTNGSGELGDNSGSNSATPVLVNTTALRTGERFAAFGGGINHSLAAVVQPVPPVVETLAAAAVKDTAITLNGRVNGNTSSTAVSFEYGLTTNYGSTVTAAPASVSGTTPTAVSAGLAGLRPGTVYHFRCVGTTAGRVLYGGDQTFTTTRFASLAGLTPGAGLLLPAFASETTRYDVTLAGTELALTPVTVDAAATVTVNGTAVASGETSPAIALNPGSNTITVVVTGAGGNTQTYQVVATRLPAMLTFSSAASVPATAGGFAVGGLTTDIALGYAPLPGTRLTVLKNTGNLPIQERFANLAQGQVLRLSFGGVEYPFVVNYQGGDGNDLVFEWAVNRLVGWGDNQSVEIGDGTSTNRLVPSPAGDAVLADRLVTRIVAGGSHAFALCADGTLVAWGGNSYGQYGDGSYTTSYTPVIVPRGGALAGQEIVGLWAGRVHSVALLADGTLAAWGENASGQLGDGTITNRIVPVRVKMDGVLAGKTVKTVSCGSSHTLALCTDGTLAAWGANGYGTWGNGGTGSSSVPVAVNLTGVLAGKTVTAISAGYYFSLAACADGTVAAWGYNVYGQLGNGGTTNSPVPVLVTPTGVLAGKTVTAVAAGETFSLALCADGTLAAWGYNSSGQLGNGSTTTSSVPVLVTRTGVLAGKTVTSVSAGQSYAMAYCADGSVATWGANASGQLGDNSTTNRTAPVLVNTSGLGSAERFSAAQAWGSRSVALVGMLPPPVPETLAATAITGGGASLAGRVSPSGNTVTVAFEYGLTTSYGSTMAAVPATASGTAPTSVSASLTGLLPATIYHYRVVVTRSGRLFYGADVSFTTSDAATLANLVADGGSLFPGFAPSQASYHLTVPNANEGMALTPTTAYPAATVRINGQAVASGTAGETLPLAVGGNSINVVVTGEDGGTLTYQVTVTRLPASFAFASAGTVPVTAGVLTAGGDAQISLGFAPLPGTNLTVVNNTGSLPIQGRFANLAQWQVISLSFGGIDYPFVVNYYGGSGNDLVLEWATRRLLGWGYNGDGSTASRSVPAPVLPGVLAGKTIVLAVTGGAHSLALASDGTLAAWGDNAYGQLGDGSSIDRAEPVAVDLSGVLAGKTIIGLVACGKHSVAVCADGTMATWGANDKGQLGDGTTIDRLKPVLVDRSGVLAGKVVVAVAATSESQNSQHCLALCADGTLVAWGFNGFGQLGDGTSVTRPSPVRVNQTGVLAGKTITSIAAGSNHSAVLCADGSVVTWGYNLLGNLGDGTTTGRYEPAAVVSSGVLAGKTVVGLSTCSDTCLVRCSDGTLATWGYGSNSQLGNGQTTYAQTTPVLVTGTGVLTGKTPVTMASGTLHHLVGCSDGSLVSWGYNSSGQLGDGSKTNRSTPVLVTATALRAGERITAVSAGGAHSLAWVASPLSPKLETLPATELADTSATLNGQVNANGTATPVAFEYGLTTAYGMSATAAPASVNGTSLTAVSAAINGLLSGTIYHFRVISPDPAGKLVGPDQTFTTTAVAALAGLTSSVGGLQPAFDSNRLAYDLTVPDSVPELTLLPVTVDASAVVTVNGTPVSSGTASQAVALAVGDNLIDVKVTGTGGATQVYQVAVTRLPAGLVFAAPTTVPFAAAGFSLDGVSAEIVLQFAPLPGSPLTLLRNTGTAPIRGGFSNLADGQTVDLIFEGIRYPFIANYQGGDGNDLVLEWANTRLLTWGNNASGQLGVDPITDRTLPGAMSAGVLSGKSIIAVAAGGTHTLVLCSDGTLAAWGSNDSGRLGDGTMINRTSPVLVDRSGVLAGKKITAISAGGSHSLALCSDGTLAAWGNNGSGRLGDGSTSSRSRPVLVDRSGVLAGKTITAIVAGGYHSLVLCSDGTLAAWGSNSEGRLGDGTGTDRAVPVLVDRSGVLAGKTVTAIVAGGFHSMVLCADGTLAAWGGNINGGLGDGTRDGRYTPVLVIRSGVLAGKVVVGIAVGEQHSLALCSDGTLAAWGYNSAGQLGIGTSYWSSSPVLVNQGGVLAGKTITSIAARDANSLALCSDGTLAAWGLNTTGQLGDGTITSQANPVLVKTSSMPTAERFVLAAAGTNFSVALAVSPQRPVAETLAASGISDTRATLNGQVNANGLNAKVAFEYGLTTDYGSTLDATPLTVTGTTAMPVSVDASGLLAGTMYHYRVIASGPGGEVTGKDQTFTTTALAALASLTLNDGLLQPAFDPNRMRYFGTVKNATTSVTLTPVTVDGRATVAVNGVPVASGTTSQAVALVEGDNLITIEVGGTGGLTRIYQVVVSRLPAVFALSASAESFAAAGFSLDGLLPKIALNYAPLPGATLTLLNNTGSAPIQGRFADLTQWQSVKLTFGGIIYPFVANYSGGDGNDLVLEWSNRRLLAWGKNDVGQVDDSLTTRPLPTEVPAGVLTGKTIVRIASGANHNLALCADGGLAAWGENGTGQLGDGSTLDRTLPVRVDPSGVLAGKLIVAIAAGAGHSLALCSDGTLAAWGDNTAGQLGDSTTTSRSRPVRVDLNGVLAGKTVTAIAAGTSNSLALCSDGTLAAWGLNNYGQLGNGIDGTNSGSNTPYPVMVDRSGVLAGKTIISIAVGYAHGVVCCSDGTLAGWGRNYEGQLGENTTTFQENVPVLVDRSGVLAGKTPVAVVAGYNYSLVMCADGTLAGFGDSGSGQLGNGSAGSFVRAPVLVNLDTALAGKAVVSLQAGSTHSAALCADGSLVVWGYNYFGGLGDGSTTNRSSPTLVATSTLRPGERFAAVSAGQSHSLALVASPPPALPVALAASGLADAAATLNGEVNASGTTAAVSFEYGLTAGYGSSVAASPVTVSGATAEPVSAALTGLLPGMTYHYRVVASGPGGVVASDDMTFTTTASSALAGLTLDGAALSPAFAPAGRSYLATVPFGTENLVLTPSANFAGATISVNGTAVESGSASQPLALGVGANPFTVTVTAADGAAVTAYTVVVTRLPLVFLVSAPSSVPLALDGFAPAGQHVAISLSFAPMPGVSLTLVDNTGASPITGTFANLIHGQRVDLSFGGTIYPFVADYFGGTGNDLVLRWANTRLLAWGNGGYGSLGGGSTTAQAAPAPVLATGLLRGRTIRAISVGNDSNVALCVDGLLATWGTNRNGQLGTGSSWSQLSQSAVPVAVNRSGVLAGKMVIAIASGGSHCLALCADGALAAWGVNNYGQLGNGTTTESAAPVLVNRAGVLAGKTITAIAAGGNHNLALCSDGTLVSWGYSNNGQLGDGTNGYRSTPVLVDRSGVLTGKTVTAIAAGGSHSLALCSDGTLVAWGDNSSAQLGDNTTTARNTPVLPRSGALAGKTVRAIAAGNLHSLVLCSDGTLAAWGANTSGEVGDGTVTQRRVPTLVDQTGALAGRTVTQIDVGLNHSLALCTDGVVVGWGDDGYGQLTTVGDALSPVVMSRGSLLDAERVTSLSSFYHNLVLASLPVPPITTTLAASGILDTGATLNGSVIPNGNSNIALGFEYGLTTDYGDSISGNPATVEAGSAVATGAVISGLTPGVTYHYRCVASTDSGVALGEDATFTTTTFGTLAGLSLSHGTLSPVFSAIRGDYLATVPFGIDQLALTPLPTHASSVVTVNGEPVASGTPSAPIALAVGGNRIQVAVVAADGLNTRSYQVTVTRLPGMIAFDAPDTVPAEAAGFSVSGNLPSISLDYQPQPGGSLTVLGNSGAAPIQGTFADLAQGQAVALTYAGTTTHFIANYFGGSGNDLVLEWANRRLLAWGDNLTGQLGIVSTSDQPAPMPVDMTGVLAGKTVIEIAAGCRHTLALCSDGTLAAWGDNRYGQLGDGTLISSQVPVRVNLAGVLDGKKIVRIAAGYDHSVALCTDGTLVAWGQNSLGEVGDGTTSNRLIPVQVNQAGVLAGKSVVAIAAGERHCLVLCGDGALVAWGYNSDGQLGNGTRTTSLTPVAVDQTGVLAGKTVVAIAAGAIHTMVLCSDGTVAGWGYNYHGQLGNGNTNSTSLPVAMNQTGVLLGKTPVAISVDTNHSLIICSDGTVAAAGYNEYGKLGDGTTTERLLPVLVDRSGALVGKLVTGISTGYSHSVAWCADGTAAGWGLNSDGQLGTNLKVGGTLANRPLPTLMDLTSMIPGERMVRIDTGLAHNLSLSDLPLPGVETLAAAAITGTRGTLNGSVNAYGNVTAVTFEYGVDETYGATVAAAPGAITGVAETAVNASLAGLQPGTIYHYRVVAACLGGVVRGADRSFTTLSDNALLAELGHDGGVIAPEFEKSRYDYLASVPFQTTAVSVRAVTDHPGAIVAVNGADGTIPISLAFGINLISVVVTAEDGETTRTYTVSLNRLPQEFVFNTPSDLPLTSDGFAAGGNPVKLVLGFAPAPGTVLTMMRNTGLGFIYGRFGNLAHGQRVSLTFEGKAVDFIANYHGGSGNDLVLQWANTQLLAWGGNGFGQLGDATTERRLVPTPVIAAGVLAEQPVLAMAGGYLHSLALCADGTLAAWGYNVHGQLGNSSQVASPVPVAVDQTGALAGKSVVAIAAGPFHNLALCEDGTIVAWGYNNHGQLGDGTRDTRRVPVVVPRVGALVSMQVVAVAAGAYQSFALGADGSVAAWGYNDEGELGDGSTTGRLISVAVDRSGALAGKQIASLAAGQYHTLALCTDGTLVSWGYNKSGQLGNNNTMAASSPVAIGGRGTLAGRTPVGISAGGSHSLACCADGTLVAWGANKFGQLGRAGESISQVPVTVDLGALTGGTGIAGLAVGGNHSLLRLADGRLIAWGENTSGQLGDGSLLSRAIPSGVTGLTAHLMAVASGVAAQHNLALRALPMPPAGTLGVTSVGLSGADLIAYAFPLDLTRPGAARLPEARWVAGEVVIRFTQPATVSDILYGAEWSATLQPGSWQEVADTGSGGEHRFAIPATGASQGFIRLKVAAKGR